MPQQTPDIDRNARSGRVGAQAVDRCRHPGQALPQQHGLVAHGNRHDDVSDAHASSVAIERGPP